MISTYPIIYAGSMMTALIATPIVSRLARRWNVLDTPDPRKVHRIPIPRIGGLAIISAMVAGVVSAYLLDADIRASFAARHAMALPIVAAGLGIFFIGFADDLFNLPSKVKLIALVVASLAVCHAGVGMDYRVIVDDPSFAWLAWPLTVLWICAVTVAINFIDGLDGLAAGIAAIACGVIAVIAAHNQDSILIVPSLALLGSLTGFLFFNFNPARIFMGDCGSMFIGFVLGVTSLRCNSKTGTLMGLTLPALALGIPLFDTMATMIRRGVLQRRSIFSAEKGHIHHRLMDRGMKHRTVVLTIYGIELVLAGIGVLTLYASPAGQWLLLAVAAAIIVIFFWRMGSVRLLETLGAFRRNAAISREQKVFRKIFEMSQLRLANAQTFDDWWRESCEAARGLHFKAIRIPLTNRDGLQRTLDWSSGPMPGPQQAITVTVPIRQRRSGGPLRADVEVWVLGSLESAGARVTLFARLMEERNVSALPTRPVPPTSNGVPSMPAEPPAPLAAAPTERPTKRLRPTRNRQVSPAMANRATPAAGGKRRVAIVHDFLYVYAGAERVLEQMIEAYPEADIFSLFDFLPQKDRRFLKGKSVTTSFIQRMPMAPTKHRHYLPLMPLAIEQLDVSRYDIVISSSYLAAKGVITSPNQIHICYCHTPVRFAWDMQAQYLQESGLTYGLKSLFARAVLHYIRNWDVRSSAGVDQFVSNSYFVARRIRKIYRREAKVIYPPVDVEQFTLCTEKDDYYVTTSRLVPYKRIDLIVEAFNRMPDKKLLVIGEGPDYLKIKGKAGPNVQLLGHQPIENLKQYVQRAKAFVFAAEEDFGIVAVEAQAAGTPVIAFGRGGVTESVIPGKTGVFFELQTIDALIDAVEQFEAGPKFDPVAIRQHAEQFSCSRFRKELSQLVNDSWDVFCAAMSIGTLAAAGDHDAEARLNEHTPSEENSPGDTLAATAKHSPRTVAPEVSS